VTHPNFFTKFSALIRTVGIEQGARQRDELNRDHAPSTAKYWGTHALRAESVETSKCLPILRESERQSLERLRFSAEAGLAGALISARIPSVSTLSEIEQAADSLSAGELRALLCHVEARLKLAESGARSKDVGRLMQTLRELSRLMGGKSWNNRDELHER